MVEPISMDDTDMMIGTPYGLMEGRDDERVTVQMANMGNEPVQLQKGTCIATVGEGEWVQNPEAGRSFTDRRAQVHVQVPSPALVSGIAASLG